jgi:hypothetical protein
MPFKGPFPLRKIFRGKFLTFNNDIFGKCSVRGKFSSVEMGLKASFYSGKLSVDWNGQENFSLSCQLWVGTNDFNTKRNFLVRSNPRIIFLSGN